MEFADYQSRTRTLLSDMIIIVIHLEQAGLY